MNFTDHAGIVAHFVDRKARGEPLPINLGVQTPPITGTCTIDGVVSLSNPKGVLCPAHGSDHSHCCHCGAIIPSGQHARVHAVALVTDPGLVLHVSHCDACVDGPGCDPTQWPQLHASCRPIEG